MINSQLNFNNDNEKKIRKFNKLYASDFDILIFSVLLLVTTNVSYDCYSFIS